MKIIKILLGLWIFLGGIGIAGVGAYQLWKVYHKVDSRVVAATGEREWVVMDTVPTDIYLPSINIDLQVIPGQIVNGVWQVSETKANYLIGSGVIAKPGNAVIYAHKRSGMFESLHKIEVGDKIVVESKDVVAVYKVYDKFETQAGDLGITEDTDTTEITLYTCHRWNDSTRYVIKARMDHFFASGFGGIVAREETSI